MATSIELLIADLDSLEVKHGIKQGFWQVEGRDNSRVYVRVFDAAGKAFVIELDCSDYGAEPIAGKLVDPESRQCVASAWPRGNATFGQWVKSDPPNLFICWDQDRNGILHHADWRARQQWTKNRNQVYAYLDFVRKLLRMPLYGHSQAT